MREQKIYLSQLVILCKRKSQSMLKGGVFCFIVLFCALLFFSKPQFHAQATFQKGNSRLEDHGSIYSILHSMGVPAEEHAIAFVMQSKRLLAKVIKKTGGQIVYKSRFGFWKVFSREFGKAKVVETPLFEKVQYKGEESLSFSIKPVSSQSFAILDLHHKKTIASGQLGEVIKFGPVEAKIVHLPQKEQIFTVHSMRSSLGKLKRDLKIKASRIEPNILILQYKHGQRTMAIGVLNALMAQFQKHLKKEHQKLAQKQLVYLEKRKLELEQDFDHAVEQHLLYLEDNAGEEGFLGLAQEAEILKKPKEKYFSRKHELDLELKRGEAPQLFSQANPLTFQKNLLAAQLSGSEEFEGINLPTAQRVSGEYMYEKEGVTSQLRQLERFLSEIQKPAFEIGALSQVLPDEVSQKLIQKAVETRLLLKNSSYYSQKERDHFTEELTIQKQFLIDHLAGKKELLQGRLTFVDQKLGRLQHLIHTLMDKEKGGVEQKLGELGEKAKYLPKKWGLESKLKLKKEMIMQIMETLSKLSESKVINHRLFHIESKPLDWADAPLQIASGHLFLLSFLGSCLWVVGSVIAILAKGCKEGLPITKEYVEEQNVKAFDQEDVSRLAVEVKAYQVIGCVHYLKTKELASALSSLGYKVLLVQGKEDLLPLSPLNFTIEQSECHHQDFPKKLTSWKTTYHCILLAYSEALAMLQVVEGIDFFILGIDRETEKELKIFPKNNYLCIFAT